MPAVSKPKAPRVGLPASGAGVATGVVATAGVGSLREQAPAMTTARAPASRAGTGSRRGRDMATPGQERNAEHRSAASRAHDAKVMRGQPAFSKLWPGQRYKGA